MVKWGLMFPTNVILMVLTLISTSWAVCSAVHLRACLCFLSPNSSEDSGDTGEVMIITIQLVNNKKK